MAADNEILFQSNMLYSENVKHPKSLFFNKPYFDQYINDFSTETVQVPIIITVENVETMSINIKEEITERTDSELAQVRKF